jgi:hypothetical protein
MFVAENELRRKIVWAVYGYSPLGSYAHTYALKSEEKEEMRIAKLLDTRGAQDTMLGGERLEP